MFCVLCVCLLSLPFTAMPDLIRFLHGTPLGLQRVVRDFRQLWGAKKASKLTAADGESTPSAKDTPTAAHGKENVDYGTVCGISRRQLELKIQHIAKKEVRLPDNRNRFYVHSDVLEKYGLDPAALAVVTAPVSGISPFSKTSGNQNVHPPPPGIMQTPTRKRTANVDVSPECFGAKAATIPVYTSHGGLVGVSKCDLMGGLPIGVGVLASGTEATPTIEKQGATLKEVITSEGVAAEGGLALPPEKKFKVDDKKPELLA